MKKVYVYLESNYGKLIYECDSVSDIRVFSSKEKVRKHISKTLRFYAGKERYPSCSEDCNRFVVDNDVLEDAGITVENGEKLTNEQIELLIKHTFEEDDFHVTLFAKRHENYDEYFEIDVSVKNVE